MRSLRWVALAALIGFIVWHTYLRGGGLEGGAAPDFEAEVLDGPPFSLKEHQGRVVVLDFWATWCGPCKMSLPALQQTYEQYRDHPGVTVVSVNTDAPQQREEIVRSFMKSRRFTFPVLLDDPRQSVQARYGVQAIPTLVVIGPDGKVRTVKVGLFARDTDGIAKHLSALIEEALPES